MTPLEAADITAAIMEKANRKRMMFMLRKRTESLLLRVGNLLFHGQGQKEVLDIDFVAHHALFQHEAHVRLYA